MDHTSYFVADSSAVDSLAIMAEDFASLTAQFKATIALMYQALMNAEPVISAQLEVIAMQKMLGNIFIFGCFLMTIFVLVRTHKEVQGVKKMSEIKIKTRWYVAIFSTLVISLAVFNFYPGYMLMELDNEVMAQRSEDAEDRLFGFSEDPASENTDAEK